MCLLKKWVPFHWDELAQCSFYALKKSLVSTPLITPPDYNTYFLLYVIVDESSIGTVLVQEYDELHGHVIYYLSHALLGSKLKYSHVDKLTLTSFHVVQRLRHYIILCKMIVITDVNPFRQGVLTRRIIGGK
jgi:hypothetical protein